MEEKNIKEISAEMLLAETLDLKFAGYRLVAISSTAKDGLEITYSFDKEYDFRNLRIHIDYETEIESISSIYGYAFMYENEIKELFGAKIKNIVLDFNEKLYRISEKTPFKEKEGE